LDRLHYIRTHDLPGLLEKLSCETIGPRGFIISHTEKGSLNLFGRHLSNKSSPLVLIQTLVNEGGHVTRGKGRGPIALTIKLLKVGDKNIHNLVFGTSKSAIVSQEIHNTVIILPSEHRMEEEARTPIPLS